MYSILLIFHKIKFLTGNTERYAKKKRAKNIPFCEVKFQVVDFFLTKWFRLPCPPDSVLNFNIQYLFTILQSEQPCPG